MNSNYHIYELTDYQKKLLDPNTEVLAEGKEKFDKLKEDIARLEGYLKGRADSDKPKLGDGDGTAYGPGSNRDLAG